MGVGLVLFPPIDPSLYMDDGLAGLSVHDEVDMGLPGYEAHRELQSDHITSTRATEGLSGPRHCFPTRSVSSTGGHAMAQHDVCSPARTSVPLCSGGAYMAVKPFLCFPRD